MFFHKSDTRVTEKQKEEGKPTDGFTLMTEVNFYLQVIRIFKNLGLLKTAVIKEKYFSQVRVMNLLGQHVSQTEFQQALQALNRNRKPVPTAAAQQQTQKRQRVSSGNRQTFIGRSKVQTPADNQCFYCDKTDHQQYRILADKERVQTCPRKISDLKQGIVRRNIHEPIQDRKPAAVLLLWNQL